MQPQKPKLDAPFLFLRTDEGKDIMLNINQVAWVDMVSDQHISLHMACGEDFNVRGTGAFSVFLAIAKRATDVSGARLAEIIERVEREFKAKSK